MSRVAIESAVAAQRGGSYASRVKRRLAGAGEKAERLIIAHADDEAVRCALVVAGDEWKGLRDVEFLLREVGK